MSKPSTEVQLQETKWNVCGHDKEMKYTAELKSTIWNQAKRLIQASPKACNVHLEKEY